jgi:RNA polymerase-binding transcription factor DksA
VSDVVTRLRERIDQIADERDDLAMRLLDATKQNRIGGWCAYCGTRIPLNRRACPGHSDLPRLENPA